MDPSEWKLWAIVLELEEILGIKVIAFEIKSLYEGNNPTRDKRYFRVSADTMFLGEFIMFLRGSQD